MNLDEENMVRRKFGGRAQVRNRECKARVAGETSFRHHVEKFRSNPVRFLLGPACVEFSWHVTPLASAQVIISRLIFTHAVVC